MSRFVGLLSGTSMDGIDVALVDFHEPVDTPAVPPALGTDLPSHRLVATKAYPLPDTLRARLIQCGKEGAGHIDSLGPLDVELGRHFAHAVLALLNKAGVPPREVRAIGSHGQTLRHHPTGRTPFTLQIADPNLIAEITGIPTVADFRRRDLAAGGQGAPLVPAFHGALFRDRIHYRVVVNIGGMANVTLLPPGAGGEIGGFDTGPGNVLLDAWAGIHLGVPMDTDGLWAERGVCRRDLLRVLRDDAFFALPPPKTTGRERFNPDWLRRKIAAVRPAPAPVDVQRTLCELTIGTIADAITDHAPACREVLVCGGGARNPLLLAGLSARLGHCLDDCIVDTTGRYGVLPDWVEAMAFAWLARRRLMGLPGNVPAVTGARRPVVLGAIYPGAQGRDSPEDMKGSLSGFRLG